MRDIKFRGKDLLNKWRYGDLVQEKWKSLLGTNEKAYMIKKDKTARTVKEETIGQYTGLKDKNGKEIYEGDIVKLKADSGYCEMTGIIIYDEYDLAFELKDLEEGTQECLWYQEQELEVIGNIYDNPELLEKEG